MHRYSTLACKV